MVLDEESLTVNVSTVLAVFDEKYGVTSNRGEIRSVTWGVSKVF